MVQLKDIYKGDKKSLDSGIQPWYLGLSTFAKIPDGTRSCVFPILTKDNGKDLQVLRPQHNQKIEITIPHDILTYQICNKLF